MNLLPMKVATMLKIPVLADPACEMVGKDGGGSRIDWELHRRLRSRGFRWGFSGGAGLFLVYAGILTAANSFDHAIGEFLRLWYWMVPLVGGFAIQVGLFAYARGATGAGAGLPARGVAATGGASAISMAACCAHHVTDVLPLVGLAGAGLFLSTYQSLFLLLGVLSNAVGIVYMLSLLGRHQLVPNTGSLLSPILNMPWRHALRMTTALALLILLGAGIAEFL